LGNTRFPTLARKEVQETFGMLLFYGLAASILFGLAGVSKSLGLRYNTGYVVQPIDFTILSKEIDPIAWLIISVVTATAAFVLAITCRGKERSSYLLYLVASLVEIALLINGQVLIAYSVSFLFGVIFIALTIILANRYKMEMQRKGVFMSFAGFLALVVFIELLAAVWRIATAIFPSLPVAILMVAGAAQTQAQLSGILFNFSTILMLIALFMWIPLTMFLVRCRTESTQPRGPLGYYVGHGFNSFRKTAVALLGLGLCVAAFVSLSPYIMQARLRGVDVLFYYARLSSIASFSAAVQQIPFEPRAVYLILLYLLKQVTGWDPFLVIIVGPVFLGTLYALATFLVTKEFTQSWLLAGLAAVLAASWLHSTIGLFAAIYANWLAMSCGLLFLYFLHKAISGKGKTSVAFAVLAGLATAVTHVWTWGVLLTASSIGFVITVLVSRKSSMSCGFRQSTKRYGLVLLGIALPIFFSMLILPGLNEGFQVGLYQVVGSMNLSGVNHLIFLLTFTLTKYVGALLSYPIALVLAIVGQICLARYDPPGSRLLASWMMVTSVSTVLLEPWYQWRLIYLVPFEVFAAMGIASIFLSVDWLSMRIAVFSDHPRLVWFVKIFLITLILFDSVNYAFVGASILPFA
jgi:hypothetical protein